MWYLTNTPIMYPMTINRLHIDSILDRFGQVKDNASEELLHLRKSILKVSPASINPLARPYPGALKLII